MAMSTFSRVPNSLRKPIPVQRALPEPQNQESSSSSSSLNEGTAKSWQDDELSPRLQASPESKNCQSLAEHKSEGIIDASTQTEEKAVERGVSINDGSHQNQVSQVEENAGPGEADTLESLIRADVRKLNSFRMLEGEGFQMPSNTKLKIINMMIQLISCGSVQEKDHRIGLIANYRPRISSANFSTLGELDHLPENPRLMVTRFADKKGSLGERWFLKEMYPLNVDDKEEGISTSSKCIPLSIKTSLGKQLRCELPRSPLSEGRIISSERAESSQISEPDISNGSKRTTEPFSGENVIKIEES